MALILHIETATPICSAALSENGKLLALREHKEGRSHASLLTSFIDELFIETNYKLANIDAVAVSKGPGSYTGLRIGVSTAKGICYALGKPLLAINSLQYLAQSLAQSTTYPDNTLFCPMLDARRMEVYTALYNRKGDVVEDIHAKIIEPESFEKYTLDYTLVLCGDGVDKCKDILTHPAFILQPKHHLSAQHMIKPAEEAFAKKQFVDTAYFEPFYLKDFVATVPTKNIFK